MNKLPFCSSFCDPLRMSTPGVSPLKSDRPLFSLFRRRINHSWYLALQDGHPLTRGNDVLSENCKVIGCRRIVFGECGSQNISPHFRQWCRRWNKVNFIWHFGYAHSVAAASGYTVNECRQWMRGTFQWSFLTIGTWVKVNEFRRGKGWGGAGWSALRRAAGLYNGAVGLLEGWNWVNVGWNSYEELEEFVFVGDDPVDIADWIRWGDDGEDEVSPWRADFWISVVAGSGTTAEIL